MRDPALAQMAAARGDAAAAYDAAAAERAIARRDRTAAAPRARSASTSSTRTPTGLPAGLADHYLALKARGLL